MPGRLLIYGATGFTGRLMAEAARARGLDAILAGRDARKLRPLAEALDLPWRAVELSDGEGLDAALRGADAVLHIAGPFAETARPMVEACLRGGVHYLDVTGELGVFRHIAAHDAEAKARGIMLMPGVGFAIVATDCLAAHVAARLPEARYLRLGLSRTDAISRGSLRTMIGLVDGTVAVRRDGRLVRVPVGRLERHFDYGAGERLSTALSWADVFTAHHTTGIPNIEVYAEAGWYARAVYQFCGWFAGPMQTAPWRTLLALQARLWPAGPSAARREAAPRVIVAEAEDRWRRKAWARLYTPDGYDFTLPAALAVAERVLAGRFRPGFQTPAAVYGAEFVRGFDGVRLEEGAGPS